MELKLIAPAVRVGTVEIARVDTVEGRRLQLLLGLAPAVGSTNEVDELRELHLLNLVRVVHHVDGHAIDAGLLNLTSLRVVRDQGALHAGVTIDHRTHDARLATGPEVTVVVGLRDNLPVLVVSRGLEGNLELGIIVDVAAAQMGEGLTARLVPTQHVANEIVAGVDERSLQRNRHAALGLVAYRLAVDVGERSNAEVDVMSLGALAIELLDDALQFVGRHVALSIDVLYHRIGIVVSIPNHSLESGLDVSNTAGDRWDKQLYGFGCQPVVVDGCSIGNAERHALGLLLRIDRGGCPVFIVFCTRDHGGHQCQSI